MTVTSNFEVFTSLSLLIGAVFMDTSYSLAELAHLVEGELVGDAELRVRGFGPLDEAGPEDLSFIVKADMSGAMAESEAGAFLVPRSVEQSGKPIIRVADPYLASALVLNKMLARPFVPTGIHPSAVVGEGCRIGEQVSIGAQVVLGDRVSVGERVSIGPGTVIGNDVTIGDECIFKAHVTIEHGTEIGARVSISPGTVIGADGFGYATDASGIHVKRPQLGIVRIGDDVEIGANCCIDRATFGVTWIQAGTKIDNLVQVAHNCVVGEHSLLVAQVGLSGSTSLGHHAVFAGQSSTTGHQVIGDRVMVAGQSAVHGDQPDGARLGGSPAFEAKQYFKAVSVFSRLPELAKQVRFLSKELDRIKERFDKT
jgi:UDP-3-O-[3-hydroxymyristoyl] glucosamine N-acyltransferase